MAPNRITRGGVTLAGLLILGILAGCGGGGTGTTSPASGAPTDDGNPTRATSTEVSNPTQAAVRSADAAVLDKVLGRQEAVAAAEAKVITGLSPRLSRMAFYFRRQEEEHIDAVLSAMRSLGLPAEPSVEPLEPGELKSDRERLLFLYALESKTIDEELSAIAKLEASWPRSLLASTVADQAQHLTLLRQALGVGPLGSVPVPFENGTAPPPE